MVRIKKAREGFTSQKLSVRKQNNPCTFHENLLPKATKKPGYPATASRGERRVFSLGYIFGY